MTTRTGAGERRAAGTGSLGCARFDEEEDHAGRRHAARPRPAFDATVFRRVIGNFMTGVVVITTEHDGAPPRHDGQRGLVALARPADAAGLPQRGERDAGGGPPLRPVRREHPRRAPGPHRRAVRPPGIGRQVRGPRGPARPHRACRCWPACWRPSSAGSPRWSAAGRTGSSSPRPCTRRRREGSPLAYFRGKFGKFELGQDAEVYRRLRQLVLGRRFGPDEALEVESLAGAADGLPVVGLLRADPPGGRQARQPRPAAGPRRHPAGRRDVRRRPRRAAGHRARGGRAGGGPALGRAARPLP